MTDEIDEVLRRTSLLGLVPDVDRKALAAASRIRAFGRGQVVFTAGDPGDTLVVVVSGRVKVVLHSADGGELTLTMVGPGEVLGDISVADGGPRSTDAETLADSRLLLVPQDAVREVCARVPAAANALTGSLAATLRRLTESASDLVFLDLPRRVAKSLLSQPRGRGGIIEPSLSQEELAHQAAGTRQSVNAALRGFERRGWIEVRGRAVLVKEPAALDRFAGP
ncbi:MAG TPA: Crp/Fnr family transcriptional regulator [Streptosporangiaceae bacterium]